MIAVIFSIIIMYLGIRLYLKGIGKSKEKYSDSDMKICRMIGFFFLSISFVILLVYLILEFFL